MHLARYPELLDEVVDCRWSARRGDDASGVARTEARAPHHYDPPSGSLVTMEELGPCPAAFLKAGVPILTDDEGSPARLRQCAVRAGFSPEISVLPSIDES